LTKKTNPIFPHKEVEMPKLEKELYEMAETAHVKITRWKIHDGRTRYAFTCPDDRFHAFSCVGTVAAFAFLHGWNAHQRHVRNWRIDKPYKEEKK
jgi:hypothetical protein